MRLPYRITLFVLALFCQTLTTQAFAITEQKLTLPNNLGTAYLYLSNQKNSGPGAVVVHEWWGLNDYARARAKQLAEAGISAIAVDMYGTGQVAAHPKDAQAFMQQALAEPGQMALRFDAALQILAQQKNVDAAQIYGVGYCFGGTVVLNQARAGAPLAGVASFHGALATTQPAQAGKFSTRVLVAHGGMDPMVPPEQVAAFVEEMTRAQANYTLLNFGNALHGFTNPAATATGQQFDMPLAYDEAADRQSWQALLQFILQP